MLYTKEELTKIMSKEASYILEDIEGLWFGEGKVIWIGIEGAPTEGEELAHFVLSKIAEEEYSDSDIVFNSKEGEEIYRVISDLWDRPEFIIRTVPELSLIKEKKFKLVEVSIPGMTDYLLFF